MGTNTLTAPAVTTPNIPFRREVASQLEAQNKLRQQLEEELQLTRQRIDNLEVLEREFKIEDGQVNPIGLEHLFADPSYNLDYSFEPSGLDEVRRDAFLKRTNAVGKIRSEMWIRRQTIAWAEQTQHQAPGQIADLEKQIDRINGNPFWKFTNLFTGTREKLAAKVLELQTQLDAAPEHLINAQAGLESATTREALIPQNTRYDAALHDKPGALEIHHRSEQAVLLSFDRSDTLTLHIPRTPSSTDFTLEIEISLDKTIKDDLLTLIGKELDIHETFDTLEENIDYAWPFDHKLVPLALEVVEVNDEERYRLPQAVWEWLKKAISS